MTKSRDTADILEDVKVDGNVTAVGQETLKDNTGAHNTGVGYRAMFNSSLSGSFNVALGNYNLYANTSGASNTALGYQSLFLNSTASNNTAVGYQALYDNTTGTQNVAVGGNALDSNTTASGNTAVGYDAASAITTGVYNTCIGIDAGKAITTADSNTMVGRFSGVNTTGTANTFIGKNCGYTVTTGSKNTILGQYNGNQHGLDIRTSSNNIVLSDGAGNPKLHIDSANTTRINHTGNIVIALNPSTLQVKSSSGQNGIKTEVQNEDYVCYGSKSTYAGNYYFAYMTNSSNGLVGSIRCSTSSTSYNTSSDYRLKENVDYTWDATTRLKQLKPARFNFIADPDTTVDGFLAHEAQAVVPEAVTGTHNEVDDDGVAVMQGIDQSKLVPLLVKTIQELEARITALEA